MRSDSLRRTAAAATELLNANHEMKARAAPQRVARMVITVREADLTLGL